MAGREFKGCELEAPWDDTAVGFKHWHQCTRIAVVTKEWIVEKEKAGE